MNKVKGRDFSRNPYRYLKDLPVVVTIKGQERYLIQECKDTNVVTKVEKKILVEEEGKSMGNGAMVVNQESNIPKSHRIQDQIIVGDTRPIAEKVRTELNYEKENNGIDLPEPEEDEFNPARLTKDNFVAKGRKRIE